MLLSESCLLQPIILGIESYEKIRNRENLPLTDTISIHLDHDIVKHFLINNQTIKILFNIDLSGRKHQIGVMEV